MSLTRRARLRALAKINLELRVIGERPDGYHELRTIFQTISLADSIELAFTPARRTKIELADDLHIADNLVTRAARAAMDAMRLTGHIEMRLTKRIPMGAGLGGGSSDAAAVLLALPALAGRSLPMDRLSRLGEQLGSDVPFFLLGGAAVGIGRGTELFPLPDGKPLPGVLVSPGIHISTAEAYRLLNSRLTSESQQNKMVTFQSRVWDGGVSRAACNDFETVVLERHGSIGAIKKRMLRAGASMALMTGSGSVVFGLFSGSAQASEVFRGFRKEKAFRFSLVGRARYRAMWWRTLEGHIGAKVWPPQDRKER
ncbi:MAG: 4-(cytidine 5'-diphospho)-2-C-methyl-D-erythritol kinase [Bryobacteraceae bacterium]